MVITKFALVCLVVAHRQTIHLFGKVKYSNTFYSYVIDIILLLGIGIDPPDMYDQPVLPTTPRSMPTPPRSTPTLPRSMPTPPPPAPTPPASNPVVMFKPSLLFGGNLNLSRNLFSHTNTNNVPHSSAEAEAKDEAKDEDEEKKDERPQKRMRTPVKDKTGPDVENMSEDDSL